jgi:hypothetical protein
MPAVNWTDELADQLRWHWDKQLRPRLSGLSDEEYIWEPAPHAWNVRPRGQSTAPVQAGGGDFTIDFAFPEPDPPPVTTISWRLGHLIVGVFGVRIANHFGGSPVDYFSFTYAGSADQALEQLDQMYDAWIRGVDALDAAQLAEPSGSSEGDFADRPLVALVLHINREVIHHGAEIALLRDLYRQRLRP